MMRGSGVVVGPLSGVATSEAVNGKGGAGGSDVAGSVVGSVVWASPGCVVGSSSSAGCGRESLSVAGGKPTQRKLNL